MNEFDDLFGDEIPEIIKKPDDAELPPVSNDEEEEQDDEDWGNEDEPDRGGVVPSTSKEKPVTNLQFLSRMLHSQLRGYLREYRSWLKDKFSDQLLSLFLDIIEKMGDEDVTPNILDAILPDLGVDDIRKDVIVSSYSLIYEDESKCLCKVTYDKFREIVYQAYFKSVNDGDAVKTLERIQNSDFFLPPYGMMESDNFQQMKFGEFDMSNIMEDLGSPLYSHFPDINNTSPIKGYIPSQVTMVSGPPGCFVGGTKLRQPDGTLKTIHEMYMSHTLATVRYMNTDTGEVDWTWKNEGAQRIGTGYDFIRIEVSTSPVPIVCTYNHPFMVLGVLKGMGWKSAEELEAGDVLVSYPMNEYVRVTNVRKVKYSKPIAYYDIVNNTEYHNYYINAGSEEICVHNCFTGDTKVMTLDGSYKTMKELNESGSTNIPVYSYNFESGEIEIQYADYCKLTKYVNRLCKITFDSGSSVMCTEDHLFPLLTGETVRADELVEGDIIRPINRKHQELDLISYANGSREVKEDPDGYEVVYSHEDLGINNSYTHRLVAKLKYPEYHGRGIIHHDKYLGGGKFDHKNNLPENIKMFNNQSEHMSCHKKKAWEDDFEHQREISIGNLPEPLALEVSDIVDTAINIGSPNFEDIAITLGCSISAVKARVYREFGNSANFAKACGFFPRRTENHADYMSQEDLISLALKCHTYKVGVLSRESGIPPIVIYGSIKKYFNDCHGFAHALGFTYRGRNDYKGVTLEDLSRIVKECGPSVKMEDFMDELGITRGAVVKLLETNKLTFNEFLSLNGIISPNFTYILDRCMYYGEVNITKLANEFRTSEENINSIIESEGWTIETLSRAVGRSYSNHKIHKIEFIDLDKPEPVYDLVETHHNHNFAIMLEGDDNKSSGIFALQSGKTLLMMIEAVEALKQGKKVLYAAIGDLKPFDFVSRICSMLMKMPMSKTALNLNGVYDSACRLFPFLKENLTVQFISPDKYTPAQWYKMIENMGEINNNDVFFIDYDTNFASERDSMYAKGDEVYTMAYTLSQKPGKYVFIGSQPKIGNWKDQALGLETASESSRKQQIIDVMITLSHDREVKNPNNHMGTINIPKNRRGGTTKFKYFMDPTGIMVPITEEAYMTIRDELYPVSVIKTDFYDGSTKLLPNAVATEGEENIG